MIVRFTQTMSKKPRKYNHKLYYRFCPIVPEAFSLVASVRLGSVALFARDPSSGAFAQFPGDANQRKKQTQNDVYRTKSRRANLDTERPSLLSRP